MTMKSLTIFAKCSIFYVWQGSEYASGYYTDRLIPSDIYLFKVNNGKTRAMCEICSKLKTKTPERRQ